MSVPYHPGKANVVADAYSHMSMGIVSHMEEQKKELLKYVHRLAHLGMSLKDSPNGGIMVYHNSESSLVVQVKSKKHLDLLLMELKESILGKLNESFSQEGMVFLGTNGEYVYQMFRI